MARPECLDDKKIERAVSLYKQGQPIVVIAKRLGVSKTTLHKILKLQKNA